MVILGLANSALCTKCPKWGARGKECGSRSSIEISLQNRARPMDEKRFAVLVHMRRASAKIL